MKKKLFYSIILIALMLNTISFTSYSAPGVDSNRQYMLETAQRVGPEEMIRAGFFRGGGLDKEDYNNPQDVYMAQQFILSLYPGRPDLFKKAVCTLGECLKESGNYTTGQINRVVNFMLNFKE